ncbi:hypothetical protein ONZ45_g4622 [Pleurotus djamor]|nr:hypothetical protein ONZ45_g4622 [Pleurotus djamor]
MSESEPQLLSDPVCVVGASCRLPGSVLRPDSLWQVLNQHSHRASSLPPPASREFSSFFTHSHKPAQLRGQWLGPEGIELFDASFFGISDSEAKTLRPNIRLGLELTQEALEHAGIPPSSLRGKPVAVIVGVGTEDGWDMKRWKDNGSSAFDHNWASSSDPSGVAGHISHFYDFTGVSNTVSNACASGSFAIDAGLHALRYGGADVAIVGAIATHFTPAALSWAAATRVASVSGRSSAFSPDADGYSPAEGAVFLVMKKLSAAKAAGDFVHGIIRATALGHNGGTRSLITPNLNMQIQVAKQALLKAGIETEDVVLVEAHGTGTPVGDAIEAEGIRSIYGPARKTPLILSSSKTVFGHTHGAAALVVPGDDTTLDLLNLDNLSPHTLTTSALNSVALDGLLKGRQVLQAARTLYELGHSLNFGAIYFKADVDISSLRSFPFSPFERKTLWPTPSPPSKPQTSEAPHGANKLDQNAFEKLVAEYGAPVLSAPALKPPRDSPPTCFLLTGANGMLGSMLLAILLQNKRNTVYCIVRGDARTRLQQAFKRHQLDAGCLGEALSRGSLVLMNTRDISSHHLGLSDEEYNRISDDIEEVVHAAWTVNFNLPLVEFYPMLRVSRNLAELCIKSKKYVRYHFIGSYASTFNYPEDLVPERAIPPMLSTSLAQGYAISKWIAEHALLLIHKSCPQAFHLSIIRVGQICGDTHTGDWSLNEMMPMMIASLPALKVLPMVFPPVSWIPSNVCAGALHETIISECMVDPQFIHLANPNIASWPEVAHTMAAAAGMGVDTLRLVSLEEYVRAIKQSPSTPVSRLLPYLISSLEAKSMPERYSSLCVNSSLTISPSLASCPPIDARLVELIVTAALKNASRVPHQQVGDDIFVFLFGPWTLTKINGDSHHTATVRRLLSTASKLLDGDSGVENGRVLFPGSPLEQQLHVVGNQLSIVQELIAAGCRPAAVVGYCLGEYAAAITAGALTETQAVGLLVHRAIAIVDADVRGQMMNVFCSISDVRRVLSTLENPPSVGIHAGPTHVVVSGSVSEIASAQEAFLRHQIKFLIYTPMDGKIEFISGVTSTVIPGSLLRAPYWLRHFKGGIDFFGALTHAHREFPQATFVDVGPGQTLTKIISRYGSDYQLHVMDPGRVLSQSLGKADYPSTMSLKAVRLQEQQMTDGPIPIPDGVDALCEAALELLSELFGYPPSNDLLGRSLHNMGLQSMDFIRFSDYYEGKTGVKMSLSAYVSDASLGQIIEASRKRDL